MAYTLKEEPPRDQRFAQPIAAFWEEIADDADDLQIASDGQSTHAKRNTYKPTSRTLISGKISGAPVYTFEDLFESDCLSPSFQTSSSPKKEPSAIKRGR